MQSLRPEEIIETLNEREEGEDHLPIIYSPTFIAYMAILLEPAAQALLELTSGTAIRQWVAQAFPDATELIAVALNSIDRMLEDQATGLQAPKASDTAFEYLDLMRRGVIQACVEELGHGAILEALRVDDVQVLPWDLWGAVKTHPGFDHLLTEPNISSDELPVTVWIGPNAFSHRMSCELAMGIILAGQLTHQNYRLEMYGQELTYFNRDTDRFCLNQNKPMWGFYSVRIEATEYQFDSLDWLQGIATGALWAGVDYLPYLTHLEWFNSKICMLQELTPARNAEGHVELRPVSDPPANPNPS